MELQEFKAKMTDAVSRLAVAQHSCTALCDVFVYRGWGKGIPTNKARLMKDYRRVTFPVRYKLGAAPESNRSWFGTPMFESNQVKRAKALRKFEKVAIRKKLYLKY